MNKIIWKPEIVTLRAIAVLLIIFFHLDHPFLNKIFKNGFIGVDIFLVISGFLITAIFLKDNFSVKNFLISRIRRLYPALLFVIFLTFVGFYFVAIPIEFQNIGKSFISSIFGLSNILYFFQSGYWEPLSSSKPFLHTWSLSLEIQFYISYLILFLFLKGRYFKEQVILLTIVSFLLYLYSFIGNFVFFYKEQYLNLLDFYLLISRFWEFGVGALTYFFYKKINKTNNYFFYVGILFILISILNNISNFYPNYSIIFCVFGASIIIIFYEEDKNNFFINNFFTHIGKISYSLYLLHYPIIIFFYYYVGVNKNFFNITCILILIYILSLFSYHFIEKPFYKNKIISTKFFLVYCFSLIIIISIFSVLMVNTQLKPLKFNEYAQIKSKFQNNFNPPYRGKGSGTNIAINQFKQKKHEKRQLLRGYNEQNKDINILIVGASYAWDLYLALELNKDLFPGYNFSFNDAELNTMMENDVYISNNNFLNTDFYFLTSQYLYKDQFENIKLYKKYLDKLDKKLVVVSNQVEFYTKGNLLLDTLVKNQTYRDELTNNNFEHFNKIYYLNLKKSVLKTNIKLKQITNELKVPFLDKMTYTCSEIKASCYAFNNKGDVNFFDYSHYTLSGAKFFGKKIYEISWLNDIFLNE
jgi:peptidoglycan/LPS O-acetylase OafA/YrhL